MSQTTVAKRVCKAPVFKGNPFLCLILAIGSIIILPALIIAVIITLGSFKAICALKRYLYMFGNCKERNSDPNIILHSV